MGKKRWSRICKKAIQPGGSQEGNTHAECMDSVGYPGMAKMPPGGRPNFSGKGGGRGAAASQNNYGR